MGWQRAREAVGAREQEVLGSERGRMLAALAPGSQIAGYRLEAAGRAADGGGVRADDERLGPGVER